jgi:ppGpp synthetase/RelA/SpoT-type nucleotidyltranferase
VAGSYQAVRDTFVSERPLYQELAEALESLLREGLRSRAVPAKLDHRAKDVDSYVKKYLRNPKYQTGERIIQDKAGVRVVIPYESDASAVESAIQAICFIDDREIKLEDLGPDRLGYLGVHYIVRMRQGQLDGSREKVLRDLQAEIQVHSMAQSAWAEVSHDLLYKAPVEVPDEHKRMINRLVALVELFDVEVARCREMIAGLPGYEQNLILDPLDRELLKFTGRAPDRGISQIITPGIMSLYGDAPAQRLFRELIKPWIETNREQLAYVFERHLDDPEVNPLLYQPETFLIFERLDNDPEGLQRAWPPTLPRELLISLSETWGKPL